MKLRRRAERFRDEIAAVVDENAERFRDDSGAFRLTASDRRRPKRYHLKLSTFSPTTYRICRAPKVKFVLIEWSVIGR